MHPVCLYPLVSASLYLARGFHPLEDAEVNENPNQNENEEKLPLDHSDFLYSTCLPQHFIS